jgi:gliding motility-associated protein GldM
MINLMYLVLTALLALNVSSEIINAFRTINGSLVTANGAIDGKNNAVYGTFQKKVEDPKTKDQALVWQPLALQAQKLSKDMSDYLEGIKTELKKEAKLEIIEGKEVYKEDDLDAATRLLVEGNKGQELLDKLTQYRQNLIDILKPESFQSPEVKAKVAAAKDGFKASLPLDLTPPKLQNSHGDGGKPWQSGYFRMTPTIAAITMISKFQNDVKNSEAQLIDFCLKQVGAVEVVYDNFQAIASQSSEYLMPGQELKITAGIGAFSKSAAPNVTIDGAGVALNAEGVAEQKLTVGGPGAYSKKVVISFKKPDGTTGTVEREIKYTVGSPTGVFASATKVNVLYLGLKNPISITSGTGDEKVSANIDNGSIVKKGGGLYEAEPASAGKANVSVSVDGKPTTFVFPVRRIPNPTPMVGQFGGGTVPVNNFKSQVGVRADMGDFVFEGVKFDVSQFTIVCTGKGFEATGPKFGVVSGAYFTPEVKSYIEMCRPGSSVLITDITVTGPDGRRKLPNSMAFNLSN